MFVLLPLAGLLGACSPEATGADPLDAGPVLDIDPTEEARPVLQAGDSVVLTVVRLAADSARVPVRDAVVFRSGDPAVIDVTPAGVTHAKKPGYVRVSARLTVGGTLREVARRIEVVPASRLAVAGDYALVARILRSDPAWGVPDGTIQTAALHVVQRGGGALLSGNFDAFCARSLGQELCDPGVGQVSGTTVGDSVVQLDLTFTGSGTAYWSGRGVLSGDTISGAFGAGGHMSGTFTAVRRRAP